MHHHQIQQDTHQESITEKKDKDPLLTIIDAKEIKEEENGVFES
jgi:hypothetical protein